MTRMIRAAAVLTILAVLLGEVGAAHALVKGPPEIDPNAAPLSLEKPDAQFPLGAEWSLVALNGKPMNGDAPSFTLDDKLRATGFSGCNTYAMTLYPARGQKLAAGGIAVTHKQCDKDTMLFERTFLVTLHSLPAWSMEGDELVIKGGPATLRFRRGL